MSEKALAYKVLSHSTNNRRTSFSSVMFSLRDAVMAPGYSLCGTQHLAVVRQRRVEDREALLGLGERL